MERFEAGLAGSFERVGSTGADPTESGPVLKPALVDEVLRRLTLGEKALAREFDVHPRTIRAWRRKGRYQPRAPRQRRSILAPHSARIALHVPPLNAALRA